MDYDQEGGAKRVDYSTAILEPSTMRSPNRLVVDDAEGGVAVDSSAVALSVTTMAALNFFDGDVVRLRGKRRRETVCYARQDESCPDGMARLNRVVRGNLRLHLGDLVTVNPCPSIKHAARIAYSPFEDSVEGISGNLYEAYVKPYFQDQLRPVRKGDRFMVHRNTENPFHTGDAVSGLSQSSKVAPRFLR